MNRNPAMQKALDRLDVEGIRYKQVSETQIKVGLYNFYPTKGTIYVDGELRARSERGIDDFVRSMHKIRDRMKRSAT